ncbi:MAG: hypothetical protein ACRCZI_11425 [Cetobacterium sp.]
MTATIEPETSNVIEVYNEDKQGKHLSALILRDQAEQVLTTLRTETRMTHAVEDLRHANNELKQQLMALVTVVGDLKQQLTTPRENHAVRVAKVGRVVKAPAVSRLSARELRLMPNGLPKHVHCYDDGGQTTTRYTIVFTSRYKHKMSGGKTKVLKLSSVPQAPTGIHHVEEFERAPDNPRYAHLGHKLGFKDLPPGCQKMVSEMYRRLWGLKG